MHSVNILRIFAFSLVLLIRHSNSNNRSFSSDVTAAILVYQNNEMAAILVYGTGISSFLFKYFVLFHHPTGATDHVSENDLYVISIVLGFFWDTLFIWSENVSPQSEDKDGGN